MTTKISKAPAAIPGGSFLMETEQGLSVCRPLKSLQTSILPAEALDEFMSWLDYFVACGDFNEAMRLWWQRIGFEQGELFIPKIKNARDTQKAARRALIKPLKTIRCTPAKTLDDILLKAEICAVLEPHNVTNRKTVAHSIINDLLSAGCTWKEAADETSV